MINRFEPLVSIIIPVHSGARYLREAIDSALAQTYPKVEVVVVNDGSADDGVIEETAKSYGSQIRYFVSESVGMANAINLGILNMRGEYFSYLNCDDYYQASKLEHQIDTLSGLDPKTFLFGWYDLQQSDGELAETKDTARIVHTKDSLNTYTTADLENPLFVVFHQLLTVGATLVHQSHFDRVGLFDPKWKVMFDYDLAFRVLRGQKIHYCETNDVVLRKPIEYEESITTQRFEESSRIWTDIDQQLTDTERIECMGTPLLFYEEIYNIFKNTDNAIAKEYFLKQCEHRKLCPLVFNSEEENEIISALVQRCERQYDELYGQKKSYESELVSIDNRYSDVAGRILERIKTLLKHERIKS